MTSRDSARGREALAQWWRRFWMGTLVLVLMTTGAVYLVVSTGGGETGDPGDAAAIPLAVGAATGAFLELLWAVVCCVGLSRDRRSL